MATHPISDVLRERMIRTPGKFIASGRPAVRHILRPEDINFQKKKKSSYIIGHLLIIYQTNRLPLVSYIRSDKAIINMTFLTLF